MMKHKDKKVTCRFSMQSYEHYKRIKKELGSNKVLLVEPKAEVVKKPSLL